MIAELWATDELVEEGFDALLAAGRSLLRRGKLEDASAHLAAALRNGYVGEADYIEACEALAEAMVARGRPREALTLGWYVGARVGVDLALVPPIDRARAALAAGRPGEAADALEPAGHLVRAAIARETEGDFARARALWTRLATTLAGGSSPYDAALAAMNVLRTAKRVGDAKGAREAAASAVHLAEEAADRFESSGERERAFDCHQVVAAIGREIARFEYVLDGTINVIRILREDHLRVQALASYAELIDAARAADEPVTAASLAHELAAYSLAERAETTSLDARRLEAELWQSVGRDASRGKSSRERALLSAALAFADAGDLRAVGAVYGELARVAVGARGDYFASAAARYEGARSARRGAAPKVASEPFPPVWHLDLLEREAAGSAAEACADVLLDRAAYGHESRRRALVGRLVALSIEEDPSPDEASLTTLARALAPLEVYAALAPLEKLASHRSPVVRAAAVSSLGRFFFKRTLVTMSARLADRDESVSAAAASAVERLAFPHAIDPLARIARSAPREAARAAALRALARIERAEAAEILLVTLADGDAAARACVVQALSASRGRVFLDVARAALPGLSRGARGEVQKILSARGVTALRAQRVGKNFAFSAATTGASA